MSILFISAYATPALAVAFVKATLLVGVIPVEPLRPPEPHLNGSQLAFQLPTGEVVSNRDLIRAIPTMSLASPVPAGLGHVQSQIASVDASQPSAVVENLLAHRSELALEDGQVRRLKALLADLRLQERAWYTRSVRRMSSKPWIHGRLIDSAAEARAAAFAILRPDQRQTAERVLRAIENGGVRGAAYLQVASAE